MRAAIQSSTFFSAAAVIPVSCRSASRNLVGATFAFAKPVLDCVSQADCILLTIFSGRFIGKPPNRGEFPRLAAVEQCTAAHQSANRRSFRKSRSVSHLQGMIISFMELRTGAIDLPEAKWMAHHSGRPH